MYRVEIIVNNQNLDNLIKEKVNLLNFEGFDLVATSKTRTLKTILVFKQRI